MKLILHWDGKIIEDINRLQKNISIDINQRYQSFNRLQREITYPSISRKKLKIPAVPKLSSENGTEIAIN